MEIKLDNKVFSVGNTITSVVGFGFSGSNFSIRFNCLSSDTGARMVKIISYNSDVILTISEERVERITRIDHLSIKEIDAFITFDNGTCLDLTDIRDKDGSRLL